MMGLGKHIDWLNVGNDKTGLGHFYQVATEGCRITGYINDFLCRQFCNCFGKVANSLPGWIKNYKIVLFIILSKLLTDLRDIFLTKDAIGQPSGCAILLSGADS